MSDEGLKRGRFQFSLRKLMLWVAVEAILLGTLTMLGLDPVGLAIAGSWVAVTAILRAAFGPLVACRLSGLGGIGLAVGLWFVLPMDDAAIVLLIILGGGAGLVPFVFVEVAWRAVDAIDTLRRRSPGRCYD
jgi:hypothetical protein